MSYRVFTISSGRVTDGAAVERLKLAGAGVEIDAVVVGEEGRGRARGVLPVQGAPTPGQPDEYGRHPERMIFAADLGETKAGKPKLVVAPTTTSDSAIVVFRTPIGYRGSNAHTGDRESREDDNVRFLPFPGQILVEGRIAQGAAGGMGSGSQGVAMVPKGVVFRTAYDGRLYGAPAAHYYFFDGEKILAATWEERAASDCF
jgi:hypothetical protein